MSAEKNSLDTGNYSWFPKLTIFRGKLRLLLRPVARLRSVTLGTTALMCLQLPDHAPSFNLSGLLVREAGWRSAVAAAPTLARG